MPNARDAVVSQNHSPSRDSKDLASQNGVLDSVLLPLLDKRCALFDIPYHGNIGDILIWQGIVDFLARHKQQVVYQASCNRYHFPRFKPDVVILFFGGGNFGTLWREHQDFKLQVIQHYPDNRIIFLPQSVHYDSEEVLASDVKILAKHRNLFICVRDMESFKTIDSHFHNTVLLLPDMAIGINLPKIKNNIISVRNKPLFLIRSDKEYVKRNYDAFFSHLNVEPVRSDWPSMENRNQYIDLLSHMSRKKCYPEKLGFLYAFHFLRPHLVRTGVDFLMPYSDIYTTRLHGGLLAILIGKNVIYFDNMDGKIKAYYNTWLIGNQKVRLISEVS